MFKSIIDSTSVTNDTIYDFSRSGGDKIDLSTIDANSKASGNQTFKFIRDASFHKKAGELRFEKKSDDMRQRLRMADFSIGFAKGDFIL